jgi:hypothetical protein
VIKVYAAIGLSLAAALAGDCLARHQRSVSSSSATTVVDSDTASCATACARLRALDCASGTPSPAGVSCEARCEAYQGFAPWNLACRTGASTCAESDACEAKP